MYYATAESSRGSDVDVPRTRNVCDVRLEQRVIQSLAYSGMRCLAEVEADRQFENDRVSDS